MYAKSLKKSRNSDQDDEHLHRERQQSEVSASKADEFPPRKRSIPYGFDFDLDEVWGPQKAHLHSVYHSRNGGSAGGVESSGSSRSSVSGGGGGSSRRRRGRQESCEDNGDRFRTSSMHREAEDSSDEFAVDNEDVFQQIDALTDRLHRMPSNSSNAADSTAAGSSSSSSSSSALPSAHTLRDGRAVVARGRHSTASSAAATVSIPGSASPSAYSSVSGYSSLGGSGRFDGSISPMSTSPRRVRNNVVGGLTPGLGLRNKQDGGGRHGRRGSHKEGRSERAGGSDAPRSISLSPQRR